MKMFNLTIGNSTIYVHADYYVTVYNNMEFYLATEDKPILVSVFPNNLIECVYVDDVQTDFTFITYFERKDYEE